MASDKDTCVLKCHVFRCNVPAKGIAKALHGMCSQIVAERAAAGSDPSPSGAALRPISAATWPLRTADPRDAVGRPPRRYEALYIGSRPVPRAMGKVSAPRPGPARSRRGSTARFSPQGWTC